MNSRNVVRRLARVAPASLMRQATTKEIPNMTTTAPTKRPSSAKNTPPAKPAKRVTSPRTPEGKSASGEAVRKARAAKRTAAVETPAVDVDSLDRVQLYNQAKAERVALKAWEASRVKDGKVVNPRTDRPATPALDRLADPGRKAKKATKALTSSKYDETTTSDLIARVTKARSTGVSFPALAVELNKVSYAHRTDWTGPKLYAFACRHDVGKLPLVKPAKAEPAKASK